MSESHVFRTVLLREDQWSDPPAPFYKGSAGIVRLSHEGDFELDECLQISANSAHAMRGHGVLERLAELGLEGTLGGGAPALFRPSQLEDARRVLYDLDHTTYGGSWEFVVAREAGEEPTEYRVAVVNREYQITLVRLGDLFTQACRQGEGVWVALG